MCFPLDKIQLWCHVSVGHQGVAWMRTKWEEIPARGASAYLLVCRRHATLLALCNTHSGRGGAGSVWIVLTVASCPSATGGGAAAAVAAAATAQHVTPLDHIAACCAPTVACPIPSPIGGAPCGHHCGPSSRSTRRLGNKHGHTPGGAGSHWDSERCSRSWGLCACSRLTFIVLGSCGLGVEGGVSVREGAGATGYNRGRNKYRINDRFQLYKLENGDKSNILTWCWWCSWCPLLQHTALDLCKHVGLALLWAAGRKEHTNTHTYH